MAKTIINNGDTGVVARGAINDNFTELYDRTEFVFVEQYGAVGDGVTDDRSAIVNAITESSGKIAFKNKTYKISSGFGFTNYLKDILVIEGNGAILDFSGNLSDGVFMPFWITPASSSLIKEDINVGDRYLKTDLSLDIGDEVELISEVSASPSHSFLKGEFAKVLTVSGDTIGFAEPLMSSYSTSDSIRKTNAVPLIVKNIKIIGNGDVNLTQQGFSFKYFKDILLENVIVERIGNTAITVEHCSGGEIHNCRTNENLKDGSGYGIGVYSCQDISIHSNRLYSARHALTVSSTTWPSRRVRVMNNVLSTTVAYTSAFDTHTGCEFIDVVDNTIIGGGINFRNPNIRCVGNTILAPTKAYAISYKNASGKDGSYAIFRGNIIHSLNEDGGDGISILFSINDNITHHIDVSDNYFGDNIVKCVDIKPSPDDGTLDNITVKNLVIKGNKGHSTSPGTDYIPIYIGAFIKYEKMLIAENIFQNDYKECIKITGATSLTSGNLKIINNHLSGLQYAISALGNGFKDIFIDNNILEMTGSDSTRYAISINQATNVTIYRNKIINSKSEGIVLGSGVDTVRISDNWEESPGGGSILNSANTTIYSGYKEWTTVNRPTNRIAGTKGYNLDDNKYEYWNGTTWVQL